MEARRQIKAPIRILLADDSMFMRTAIAHMIGEDPEFCVVGTAQDGLEALQKVRSLQPDVVILDIEMPYLDGLGFLTRLMAEDPRPVIVLSSHTAHGAEVTLKALELGAFECIGKPPTKTEIISLQQYLGAAIRAAWSAKHRLHRQTPVSIHQDLETGEDPQVPPAFIAIGASTGGPKAIQDILRQLPTDFPIGIVIVQHMPAGFTAAFARRLDETCAIRVREARNQDVIEPGCALVAPAGLHMTVCRQSRSRYGVRLSSEPGRALHVPSVDVLMLSAAEAAGAHAMGVILTGMGNDGARGMKAIFDRGGWTVGQDEASCVVYGMPRACAEMSVLRRSLPLSRIAEQMQQIACCTRA